jgi:hypothetical protein
MENLLVKIFRSIPYILANSFMKNFFIEFHPAFFKNGISNNTTYLEEEHPDPKEEEVI